MSAKSNAEILVLSNIQAKALAGSLLAVGEELYRLKDYDPAYPGQPPWRSGAEGKAYPLLGPDGAVVAYLKFFTRPTPKRLDRTAWLIGQQIHSWMPGLAAAPLFWIDTRVGTRSAEIEFDFAGYLAVAVPGDTWLEVKNHIVETRSPVSDEFRWRCVDDLLVATAALERAEIVHGDLSPNNIVVDVGAPSDQPALYLIDFDAFVAPAAGANRAVSVREGGTFGTEGYCPVDLCQRVAEGDSSAAPYSDRFGRDMLMLELLLVDSRFSPDDSPPYWDRQRLAQALAARLAECDESRRGALAYLTWAEVFSLAERERPTSQELAAALGLELPAAPEIDATISRSPPAHLGVRAFSARARKRSRRRPSTRPVAGPPPPPTSPAHPPSLAQWLVPAQIVPRTYRRPRSTTPKDSPATILATVIFAIILCLLLFIPSCPDARGMGRGMRGGSSAGSSGRTAAKLSVDVRGGVTRTARLRD